MNDINKLSDQIKGQGEFEANALMAAFVRNQDQLDDAIKTMQETDYLTHWDKMPDIQRISQLGAAVVKLGDAYRAMNSVRCNL
jgi:ATP/maltotriose-dependent transcriptional regulator MalT